jgi:hypothetical protein
VRLVREREDGKDHCTIRPPARSLANWLSLLARELTGSAPLCIYREDVDVEKFGALALSRAWNSANFTRAMTQPGRFASTFAR